MQQRSCAEMPGLCSIFICLLDEKDSICEDFFFAPFPDKGLFLAQSNGQNRVFGAVSI